jgi:hypothetical protein
MQPAATSRSVDSDHSPAEEAVPEQAEEPPDSSCAPCIPAPSAPGVGISGIPDGGGQSILRQLPAIMRKHIYTGAMGATYC